MKKRTLCSKFHVRFHAISIMKCDKRVGCSLIDIILHKKSHPSFSYVLLMCIAFCGLIGSVKSSPGTPTNARHEVKLLAGAAMPSA